MGHFPGSFPGSFPRRGGRLYRVAGLYGRVCSGSAGRAGLCSGATDPVLLSVGEASTSQLPTITLLLVAPDLAQHGAESLVGHDRALRHTGSLVKEDTAGERLVAVVDLGASILVLMHAAAFAREGQRLGPGLDQVHDPFVVEGQVSRQLALLLPGEDPVEVLVVAQRTVRIMRTHRLSTESSVVVGAEPRQVRVAGLDRRDRPQAQLLHQSILERQVSTLDPSFGLGRVGADDVDV